MSLQTIQQQALEIYHFLKQYTSIWSQEVLNDFPHTLNAYDPSWLSQMLELSEQECWQWDCGKIPTTLQGSPLEKFKIKCDNLIRPTPLSNKEDLNLPSWAFHKVSQKKRHEISCLIQFLKESETLKRKDQSIVDIGGGQGHLSRIIAHYFGLPVTCLDQNYDFIELGMKRLKKYPPPSGAETVDFIRLKFGQNDPLEREIFTEKTLSLGLHTCGPLAIKHIDQFINSNGTGMVNFGCCYHLLKSQDMFYLSHFAQTNLKDLVISSHALTLATRGHSYISFKDYQLKKKVKFYRYALHLFLQQKMGIQNFMAVGSAKTQDYLSLSFSDYVFSKIPEDIQKKTSQEEAQDFYEKKETQETIYKMYLANLIRWKFGRVIEYYLLLNRALYLFEKGRECKLYSFFDESLSPRNIGLVSIT